MIRFLILRFVLPILLFLVIRTVLRSLALDARHSSAGYRSGPRSAPPRDIPAGTELKKDPVCGTYVSTTASLTRTINGQVVHFCSEECLHKYRAA